MEKPPSWVYAVGAAFAATWTALIVLFIRRSQPAAPAINIWNGQMPAMPVMPALPALPTLPGMPVVQVANKKTANLVGSSRMATYTLPTSEGARVMTAATDRHWQARVRNIGPPGSVARLADSPNNLNYPTMSVAIPAGDDFEITVAPRAGLFAIGDVEGVQLTVMASELSA